MASAVMRPPVLIPRPWTLTPTSLNYQFSTQRIRSNHRSHYAQNIRTARSRLKSPSMHTWSRSFHHSSSARSARASAIPHISVHIAASSSGKGGKFNPEKSTYDFDPNEAPALGLQNEKHSIFQKRRARPDSGQDAYFVAPVGQDHNEIAFGICDGVGGWTDHGIDPADFSHGLCHYMARNAMAWQPSADKNTRLKPQELLEMAYQNTVKDPQIKAGGSTACVGIADGSGRIRIANLGDSGYVQLRRGAIQHYSNPQTHAFNTPFQMSLTPPEILAQAMIFGGLPLNDLPDRADLADYQLQHGDVLVLATDGVWDNLSSQDVLNIVSTQLRDLGVWERTSDRGYVVTDKLSSFVDKTHATSEHQLTGTLQSALAAAIAGEAKAASMNRKRDGPFAKAWQKQMPYDAYHGGKMDDISVLVIIPVNRGSEIEPGQLKAKL